MWDNFYSSCEISGFRQEVDQNCALLGHYTAYSGNSLTTFREKVQESKKMLDFKELPIYAASWPRMAYFTSFKFRPCTKHNDVQYS